MAQILLRSDSDFLGQVIKILQNSGNYKNIDSYDSDCEESLTWGQDIPTIVPSSVAVFARA